MKQALLEVLILLYHNYVKREQQRLPQLEQWFIEVRKRSFLVEQLEKGIVVENQETSSNYSDTSATRLYTEDELEKLSMECIRYLITLEQKGTITAAQREDIIQKALTSQEPVELSELKWLTYKIIAKNKTEHFLKQIELVIFNPQSTKHYH